MSLYDGAQQETEAGAVSESTLEARGRLTVSVEALSHSWLPLCYGTTGAPRNLPPETAEEDYDHTTAHCPQCLSHHFKTKTVVKYDCSDCGHHWEFESGDDE